MRILVWLLIALAAIYGFYSAAMALWSYVEVRSAAETAYLEKGSGDRYGRADRIRDAILKQVREAGVAVDDREVFVTDEEQGIRVLVRWTYPVIVYKQETVLAIPLAHERVFGAPRR
jgi:hypothetical protein